MRTFSIIWTYPKSFSLLSWVISKRIKRPYSHVAISMGEKLYEATGGSVVDNPLSEKVKGYNVVQACNLSIPDSHYAIMEAFLKEQVGDEYSYWGAFASTLRLPRMLGVGKDGDEEFICSELAIRALEEAEIIDRGQLEKAPDYITPKGVEELLIKRGHSMNKKK